MYPIFSHSLGSLIEIFVKRIRGTDSLQRNLFYKDFYWGAVFLINTLNWYVS